MTLLAALSFLRKVGHQLEHVLLGAVDGRGSHLGGHHVGAQQLPAQRLILQLEQTDALGEKGISLRQHFICLAQLLRLALQVLHLHLLTVTRRLRCHAILQFPARERERLLGVVSSGTTF